MTSLQTYGPWESLFLSLPTATLPLRSILPSRWS